MPDERSNDQELGRQLAAFGETLEAATGEPIRPDSNRSNVSTVGRVPRRWWAIAGSAAACAVAVAGVVAVSGRNADAPGAASPPISPPVRTEPDVIGPDVSIPDVPDDPFGLADRGWQLRDRVVQDAWVVDDAYLCDERLEVEVLRGLPVVQDHYVRGASFMTATFVDLGTSDAVAERFAALGDAEAFCRAIDPDIDDAEVPVPVVAGRSYGYAVSSGVAVVVPGDDGRAVYLRTGNMTPSEVVDEIVPLIEAYLVPPLTPVPDDPLGLEADGWRLIERDELPFEFPAEVACPGTDALVELSGAPTVHDILQPPDGSGVDVDINVIDVGSLDVGNAVADAFLAFGDCVGAEVGVEPEIGAMSSVRATWFRAGPEFAIATVVGEGARTIVLEIENGTFSDDLIGDLAQRAARFLSGDAPVNE